MNNINKELLREKIVDVENKAVRLTKISNINQNKDKNCYVNCDGFGRIRAYDGFNLFLCNSVNNKQKRLLRGISPTVNKFNTQVFQIVGCNMRCWYCFVDDSILSAKSENSEMITVTELIDMFIKEKRTTSILDLSGGQPDLVPEWCLWVMEELERRGMVGEIFVWIDDNLTTIDLMEKYLTDDQIRYMARFPKHSRACCFKGYDDLTYKFNIRNNFMDFEEQINAFKKLYEYGFDLYAYITLTSPAGTANKSKIEEFIKKIREININLPLRIIPLKIKEFAVTSARINNIYSSALKEQFIAYRYWEEILNKFYTSEELEKPFEEIRI